MSSGSTFWAGCRSQEATTRSSWPSGTGVRASMGRTAIRALGKPEAVFFDVKGMFDKYESDGRL